MVTPLIKRRPGSYERTPEHRLLMGWRKIGCKPSNWRGGKYLGADGYVWIYNPKHPHAQSRYVKQARLILEEKLGRYLLQGYEPHHKNGIRDDDAPENLEEILHRTHAIWNLNRQGRIRK